MRTLILSTTTLLAGLLLAGPGCTTQVVGPGGIEAAGPVPMPLQPVPIASADRLRTTSPGPAPKATGDPADPCAMRMQNLITPLYEYYILHKRLPDRLEDIRSVADIETELNFTCPVSGKPYVYNPVGLQAQAGDTLHLILYDATPAHDGRRWGVVMGPTPNRYGQVFYQMVVVQLTEKVFKSFVPVPAPHAPPAGSTGSPQAGSTGSPQAGSTGSPQAGSTGSPQAGSGQGQPAAALPADPQGPEPRAQTPPAARGE